MELITVEQLASKKDCNKSYIYKLVSSGKLSADKIGNQIVFNADSTEIKDFLEPIPIG